MPRVRWKPHRLRGKLTSPQLLALLIGDADNVFPTDAARRAAWTEHTKELKELMKGETCWAEIMFDLGGFREGEGWRISAALERIALEKEALTTKGETWNHKTERK